MYAFQCHLKVASRLVGQVPQPNQDKSYKIIVCALHPSDFKEPDHCQITHECVRCANLGYNCCGLLAGGPVSGQLGPGEEVAGITKSELLLAFSVWGIKGIKELTGLSDSSGTLDESTGASEDPDESTDSSEDPDGSTDLSGFVLLIPEQTQTHLDSSGYTDESGSHPTHMYITHKDKLRNNRKPLKEIKEQYK
ncbi:uncharacterized protein MELLADRAFT_111539 [Melampsora larici-populina 98AG31]|uniref:Uncharacterized protein n=1 Tax=Melampsora larici-populina (strain 98AG31 / pathotype 3-4-7) TaxID=747676 RepID=F4S3I3_MELLP|nr:uncharacterized protein MELLADRAFT_111539 [Melampsora larici-populina 98AG31]EGG00832.1 hypothetical protein MELLADRAFT_111539 [Melampsora larici-populina 98AG31]